MKHYIQLFFLALLAFGPQAGSAEEAQLITWTNLVMHVEFEDPFEALTSAQLMDLGIYARVKGLQQRKGSAVSEGMREEMESARKKLVAQGVDIDGLLAKREEIKQLRIQRAKAVNQDIEGKTVRMAGYALALEYDGKKIKEFLLVPWVGACIHTPPPPPNQILHVTAKNPIQVASRYEPVWIEGILKSGDVQKELYLVDGSARIDIGYSMTDAKVKKYKAPGTRLP